MKLVDMRGLKLRPLRGPGSSPGIGIIKIFYQHALILVCYLFFLFFILFIIKNEYSTFLPMNYSFLIQQISLVLSLDFWVFHVIFFYLFLWFFFIFTIKILLNTFVKFTNYTTDSLYFYFSFYYLKSFFLLHLLIFNFYYMCNYLFNFKY